MFEGRCEEVRMEEWGDERAPGLVKEHKKKKKKKKKKKEKLRSSKNKFYREVRASLYPFPDRFQKILIPQLSIRDLNV
jgi:hypothetical protein